MNKNTVLIIGGLAIVGVAGYFAWTYYQKQKQTAAQQPTQGNYVPPNTPAGNSTADIINAGANALDTLAGTFGL